MEKGSFGDFGKTFKKVLRTCNWILGFWRVSSDFAFRETDCELSTWQAQTGASHQEKSKVMNEPFYQ